MNTPQPMCPKSDLTTDLEPVLSSLLTTLVTQKEVGGVCSLACSPKHSKKTKNTGG